MMNLVKMTSLWHHPLQKHLLDVQRTGSAVYYRRIIWKPRKVTRNRNFQGSFWHCDIKKRAVTSFVFGLDEWHQIGFTLGGRGSTESFQPWHEFLLLIGVQDGRMNENIIEILLSRVRIWICFARPTSAWPKRKHEKWTIQRKRTVFFARVVLKKCW